jgi:hypothetical protein
MIASDHVSVWRYAMTLTPLPRVLASALVGIPGSVLLIFGAACTAGAGTPPPSRASEVIRAEEIQASSASNAYDLIRQLRPNWLRSRGPGSIRDPQPVLPVVYLGDISHGPVETLQGFSTNGIQEIRYINATTATTRFGSGHAGGVIQLFVRR